MSLPKDTRFWIGISFIVISVSGILLWVVLTDPVNFTPIQNFLIQIILTVCGSFGSFLIGVPIQESRPQIRVKDRYENLLAVFLGIREVIGYIQFIEEKPRLAEQQKTEGMLKDYEMTSRFLLGHSSQWLRTLESCLGFWNEYAPEQVGEMHSSVFDRGENQ